jgi:TolB-like protein/Tfp pilus assembly protein PilF
MADFWQRLQQRKLVQWAVAYAAASFALLQGTDLVGQRFGWPDAIERVLIIAVCIGFFVTLLLAWYHGEQGRQGASGTELLLIALVLVVGGIVLWRVVASGKAASSATTSAPDGTTVASAASGTTPREAEVDIPAKSIAVLPFENLSADKDNAYFASGMQDMILTKLADIGDLKVISRTSTREYGSRPENLKLIARQLGVSSVLEGSVQKSGNEVLINVQLIDARSDNHLWAQSYQRTLDNIFGVEGEVAVKIADALQARLSPKEAAAVARIPTTNPDAYALYLKANDQIERFYQGEADPKRAEQSIAYLEQAVADDPQFALAYATLARMQNALVMNQMRDTPQLRSDALANVQKALALQPELVEAHKVFGLVLSGSGQKDRALEQFGIAQRLAPNDADLAEKLAQNHAASGDWPKAASEAARAVQLDPRNSHHYQWSANINAATRRYADAVKIAQAGLAINPGDIAVRDLLATVFQLQGNLDAAQRQWELMAAQDPQLGEDLVELLLQSRRDPVAALRVLQDTPPMASYAQAGSHNLLVGAAQLALGRKTEGMATLQQARSEVNAALQVHPDTARLYLELARIDTELGDKAAALQAADRSLAIAAASTNWMDQFRMPDYMLGKARVLARFGDAAGATVLLDKVLQAPGSGLAISVPALKSDAEWDPIRNDPRFQALLVAPADAISSAAP